MRDSGADAVIDIHLQHGTPVHRRLFLRRNTAGDEARCSPEAPPRHVRLMVASRPATVRPMRRDVFSSNHVGSLPTAAFVVRTSRALNEASKVAAVDVNEPPPLFEGAEIVDT